MSMDVCELSYFIIAGSVCPFAFPSQGLRFPWSNAKFWHCLAATIGTGNGVVLEIDRAYHQKTDLICYGTGWIACSFGMILYDVSGIQEGYFKMKNPMPSLSL